MKPATKYASRLVNFRSALVAAIALVASESLVLAQNEPPAGGQGGGQGQGQGQEGGGGGNRGGRGNGGGNGGGMGRGFGGNMGGGMGRGMMGGMGRGMQDIREAMTPDFERSDIRIFVRQLNLTEDQSGVLENLFVDYEAAYQPEADAIMSAMTEIGRNMMRSFMTPERQEQMRQTWESVQQELQAAQQNGEMDEDARREFIRQRMAAAAEKFAQTAEASGIDAEVKAAMGELLDKMEGWQSRKAQLRDNFSTGLKAVLDDDQLSQWPAFERFLTREKSLPRGRISGENVNLFLVVDDLRLPPDEFAKVEPLFNDYEGRLDTALRARNTYLEESMPRLFKAVQDSDVDGAKRIFQRQAELRSAVRDVNEEYRGAMVGALGESSWAKQLDKAVLTAGWDRIYRATATERMFDEAMKLEDITPETLQAIVDLYGSYRTEIGSINDRLRNLARSEEPASIVREGERFVSMIGQGVSGMARNFGRGGFGGPGGPGGDTAEDPMRKAFDERSAVGERYQERLKALLTPEQFEKLPRSTRGGGGGGAGAFGGAEGVQRMLERIPEEQRKALLERVDTNKNGTIDEDELGGVREYMREQFQNMGGGRGGPGGGQGGGNGGGGRGRGQGGGNGGSPEV